MSEPGLRILAIVTGEYGKRQVANILERGPSTWLVNDWRPPSPLPQMIDDPDELVPETLPPSDLLLSFAETPAVAQLLPRIAAITGAGSVIAGVDNETWLPRGLAAQLIGWLGEMGVTCITPKPWCSLTQTQYGVSRRHQEPYDDRHIAAFARWFGKPDLRVSVDPATRTITAVEVLRDAVCGSAAFVAAQIKGMPVDDAEQAAGLLHHHYPCLAGMNVDADFNDTLMHVSGNALKECIAEQTRSFKLVNFIVPGR